MLYFFIGWQLTDHLNGNTHTVPWSKTHILLTGRKEANFIDFISMLLQKRANQASFKFNKQKHYWCLLYQHIFFIFRTTPWRSMNLLLQDEEDEAPRVSEIKSHIQEEAQPERESRYFLKAHGLNIRRKKKSSITSVILVYQCIWKSSRKEENQFLTLTPSGGSTNIVVLSVWSFCCV